MTRQQLAGGATCVALQQEQAWLFSFHQGIHHDDTELFIQWCFKARVIWRASKIAKKRRALSDLGRLYSQPVLYPTTNNVHTQATTPRHSLHMPVSSVTPLMRQSLKRGLESDEAGRRAWDHIINKRRNVEAFMDTSEDDAEDPDAMTGIITFLQPQAQQQQPL
ncbi:hypothetical protein DFQ26_003928 [Actinomortierella ambigua]|nr:hypothetical protein DFQ26_003928 [Actinomortierella ambigua]